MVLVDLISTAKKVFVATSMIGFVKLSLWVALLMEIAARDFTVISSRIGLARYYQERHASTTVTALNLNTATGVLMLVGEYVR